MLYNLTNHWKNNGKESQDNTNIPWLFQDIWFHIQRKAAADATHIWSSSRNSYRYDDALQKHESNGSLSRGRHRLLRSMESCKETSTACLFIQCLDKICQISIDLTKENCFTLKMARRKRYSIADAHYVDDLALLANTSAKAESQPNSWEQATGGIDLYVNEKKKAQKKTTKRK